MPVISMNDFTEGRCLAVIFFQYFTVFTPAMHGVLGQFCDVQLIKFYMSFDCLEPNAGWFVFINFSVA